MGDALDGVVKTLLFFPTVLLLKVTAYGMLVRAVFRFWAQGRPPEQDRTSWWAQALGGFVAVIPALLAFAALLTLLLVLLSLQIR